MSRDVHFEWLSSMAQKPIPSVVCDDAAGNPRRIMMEAALC